METTLEGTNIPKDNIFHPGLLKNKNSKRRCRVKNDILTPRGEKKRRFHRISEIRKKNSDNICEGKIMAIFKGSGRKRNFKIGSEGIIRRKEVRILIKGGMGGQDIRHTNTRFS
ncbi:hypothetical protein Tco_0025359 [Tanacetum coccineum]